MSDRDALFQAVLAAPDDDAPRLVYADWLEENGQPDRAEFVRVQCAMDRIPPGTARWQPLHERSARLERDNRQAWAGPALELVLNAEFRRGFVDRVRVTVDQFVTAARALLALEPVRAWEFVSAHFFIHGSGFNRLAAEPAFGGVRGLHLGHYAPDELLQTLSESPHLGGLRSLIIMGRRAGGETIARFFEAAAGIDELDAEGGHIADFKDLWRRGAPARLRKLSLVQCHLSDHTVASLVHSRALANLEVLRLDGNDFYHPAAAAIAESDHLGRLRELSLAGAPVGDEGAWKLAESKALRNLRVLNLANCQVDSAGAQALADSPHLGNLECLCLDNNRVSVEVEAELEKRFGPGVCSFSWGLS